MKLFLNHCHLDILTYIHIMYIIYIYKRDSKRSNHWAKSLLLFRGHAITRANRDVFSINSHVLGNKTQLYLNQNTMNFLKKKYLRKCRLRNVHFVPPVIFYLVYAIYVLSKTAHLMPTLRPRQNGRRFADDFFDAFSIMLCFACLYMFYLYVCTSSA